MNEMTQKRSSYLLILLLLKPIDFKSGETEYFSMTFIKNNDQNKLVLNL